MAERLEDIAARMVAKGKGLLAADESTGTIGKRFKAIGLESTADSRRDYREMLFRTDEAMRNYVSGVILYDETIRQSAADGTTIIFTHGGPVVISAAWASGVRIEGNVFKATIGAAENTSFCTIVSGPRLVGYNDVGHLRAIADSDVPYAPVPESEH